MDGLEELAFCLLRTLRGISSLSLLVVACPVLEMLLFCFFAAGGESADLSRFSLPGFVFFKGLLHAEAGVADALALLGLVLDVTVDAAGFESLVFDFRFLGLDVASTGDITFDADFST